MKNKIAIIVGLFLVTFLNGCGTVPFHQAQTAVAVHHGFFDSPDAQPATVRAQSSPVAASVAKIVHLMEAADVCCLIASGVLFYFGQIVPGVKLALAGIALPVCAVWFNYHYGLVIAGLLISSAVGFLWAVNKKHPEYLAAIESNIMAEIRGLREDVLPAISSPLIPKAKDALPITGG